MTQKSLDKKKAKKLEWEKEFENQFGIDNELAKEIKSFISSILDKQRTELLEEIKDLQTYVLFNDTEKLISLEKVESLLNDKND